MEKYYKTLFFIGLSIVLSGQVFAQKWVKVCAGGRFSAALRSDGTVWETGRNDQFQLGTGTNDTTPVLYFQQAGSDTDWVNLEAGEAHCLALKRNGTLWAWGNNANGELGVGDSSDRSAPEQVGVDNDWKYIYASSFASYAIKKDGSLWGWGYNFFGTIGDSSNIDRALPVKIDAKQAWKKICAGYRFSVALRSDGSLWASGSNSDGNLGNGTGLNTVTFVSVNKDTDWIDISTGFNFAIALKRNGTIWSWGYNSSGQLGQGNVSTFPQPTQILSDKDWVSIFTGCLSGYAIKKDGSLWDWGSNYIGQLGNGNNNQENYPRKIGTDLNWKSVSGGKGYHVTSNTVRAFQTLGLKGDGSIMCVVGQNDYGQLGIGTTDPINSFNCSINASVQDLVFNQNSKISLFPNPCTDYVHVSFSDPVPSNIQIHIFDLSGKEVLMQNMGALLNASQIDVSSISKGIYTVEMISNASAYRAKLVKE